MWKFYETSFAPAAILAMLALVLYLAATDAAPPTEVLPAADPAAVYRDVRSLLLDEGAVILELKETERGGFVVVKFAPDEDGTPPRPLRRFKQSVDEWPGSGPTFLRKTETSLDLDFNGVDVFAVEVADRLLVSVGR